MGSDPMPPWLTTEFFMNQLGSPLKMKELVLNLHRKVEPWPKGMKLEDGWSRWHLCQVDGKKAVTPDTREAVRLSILLKSTREITGAT